jgi:hypothetical protein
MPNMKQLSKRQFLAAEPQPGPDRIPSPNSISYAGIHRLTTLMASTAFRSPYAGLVGPRLGRNGATGPCQRPWPNYLMRANVRNGWKRTLSPLQYRGQSDKADHCDKLHNQSNVPLITAEHIPTHEHDAPSSKQGS